MLRLAFTVAALSACGRLGFDDEPSMKPAECTLAIDVGAPRLNFNSTRAVQATGGTDPIQWSITGDQANATIDPLGVVSAGEAPSDVNVVAVDANMCSATQPLTIGGDTLWYVGGTYMTVPQKTVMKSTDGVTWTTAGDLPAARSSGALWVFHDRMYWATGSNGSQADDVYATSDGVTWTAVGHVPIAVNNPGTTVFDDRMWLIGGAGAGSDTANVYTSNDGSTWTMVGTLPMENHGGSAVMSRGRVWYLGGHDNAGGLFDWALSTTDGVTWTQNKKLPTGREYAAAVDIAGEILLSGGQDLTPTPITSLVATTDGTAWSSLAALPAARAHTALALFGGRLWSIGGSDSNGPVFQLAAPTASAWTTPTTSGWMARSSGRVAVFSAP